MNVLRFEIEKDTARPALRAVRAGIADRRHMNKAAAEGMLKPVQGSLRGMMGSNHNPFGVKSSFWHQMLSGTKAGVDDESGYVLTPRPVALRAFGGTVTPVMAKYLAIPARSEAYGKPLKDFSDLEFVLIHNGRFGESAMLVQKPLPTGQKTRGKRTKDEQGRTSIDARAQGGGVFYWLVKSATIAPNDDVLPSRDELAAAAAGGVRQYLGALAVRSRRAS